MSSLEQLQQRLNNLLKVFDNPEPLPPLAQVALLTTVGELQQQIEQLKTSNATDSNFGHKSSSNHKTGVPLVPLIRTSSNASSSSSSKQNKTKTKYNSPASSSSELDRAGHSDSR